MFFCPPLDGHQVAHGRPLATMPHLLVSILLPLLPFLLVQLLTEISRLISNIQHAEFTKPLSVCDETVWAKIILRIPVEMFDGDQLNCYYNADI